MCRRKTNKMVYNNKNNPTFFSSVFINSITNKNIKFSSKYKSFSRILLNKKQI